MTITIQQAGQGTFFGQPLRELGLNDALTTASVLPTGIKVFLASFPVGISARMLSYHCAVAAVGTLKIGIYRFSDGGKVTEFQVSSSRTGIVSVPCDLNLSPGLYWIALTCTNAFEMTASLFAFGVAYNDCPVGKYPYIAWIPLTATPGVLVDAIRLADFAPGVALPDIPLMRLHGAGSNVYEDKYFMSVGAGGSYALLNSIPVDIAVDGSLVVLGIGTRGNSQVVSALLGSWPLTKIRDDHPGVDCRTELWYIKNPPQGNGTIWVNVSTPTDIVVMAACLRNVSDLVADYGATGAGAHASISVGGGPQAVGVAVAIKQDYANRLAQCDLPESQGTYRGVEFAYAIPPAGLWLGLSTVELDAALPTKSIYYDLVGVLPPWAMSAAAFRTTA